MTPPVYYKLLFFVLDHLSRRPGRQALIAVACWIILSHFMNLVTVSVAGYQRELNYKHNDGSYSAFGKSDESGNTWSVT